MATATKDQNQSSFETYGHDVKREAAEAAGAAAKSAKNVGAATVQAVDAAAGNVGQGIESLGKQVRKNLPSEGYVGAAAGAVADGMEKTGKYLEEGGISGASEDLVALIKANPVPAVLVGIGLGFLLARATRG